MTYFLIAYFTISTIYAIYVYKYAYKQLSNFLANLLFGPFTILVLLYKYIFDIEDRYF